MNQLQYFVLGFCFVSVLTSSVNDSTPRKCGVQIKPIPSEAIKVVTAAEIGEFPWVALLGYVKPGQTEHFSCAGVLISLRYVLTAGHCASAISAKHAGKLTTVRLGEQNQNTEIDCEKIGGKENCAEAPVDIEVEEIILHPDYDDKSISHHHDIAIIKLKEDAPYTNDIRPICLPLNGEKSSPGQKLFLSGWDRSNQKEIKQKVSVPILETSVCQSSYEKIRNIEISKGQLCVGSGEDTCIALGGSPLMGTSSDGKEFYLEGIESFGPAKCGQGGIPDVFTRVSEYIPWIQSTILNLES